MKRLSMLLDSNGIPYSSGTFDWVEGSGVRLNDFTPPRKFETPESIFARQEEGRTGAAFHYGNDLSHHSQQLLTLQYLRDNAGFDNVVWCVVHFTKGQLVMAMDVATGLWCERKVG